MDRSTSRPPPLPSSPALHLEHRCRSRCRSRTSWQPCLVVMLAARVAAGRSHPHQQMRFARKTWAGARADRLPAGSMPPFVLYRRSFKHPSSALAFDRALRLRFLPRTTTAGFRNRPAAHQLHSGNDDAPILCFKRQREQHHACANWTVQVWWSGPP